MSEQELTYKGHTLLVRFTSCRSEPDVGIMTDYPEFSSIKLVYKERERELPDAFISADLWDFLYNETELDF